MAHRPLSGQTLLNVIPDELEDDEELDDDPELEEKKRNGACQFLTDNIASKMPNLPLVIVQGKFGISKNWSEC